MTIILNGEEKDVPDGITVTGLLEHLNIQHQRVAVERNEEIVKKAAYGETSPQGRRRSGSGELHGRRVKNRHGDTDAETRGRCGEEKSTRAKEGASKRRGDGVAWGRGENTTSP